MKEILCLMAKQSFEKYVGKDIPVSAYIVSSTQVENNGHCLLLYLTGITIILLDESHVVKLLTTYTCLWQTTCRFLDSSHHLMYHVIHPQDTFCHVKNTHI